MSPKQLGETSNPPQSIEDKVDLILQALKEFNNRHESHQTRMNVSNLRLSGFTQHFDRFFTMWMAGQTPHQLDRLNTPPHMATMVST